MAIIKAYGDQYPRNLDNFSAALENVILGKTNWRINI